MVTPNLPEAEVIGGCRIASAADARDAARRIHDLGAAAVAGHRRPRPYGADIVDVLLDDGVFHEFRTPRIDAPNRHGTGCTFASAIAAYLALGRALPDAAMRAQTYVARRHRARARNGSRSWAGPPFLAITTGPER